ncbi:MAG: DUF2029 domain-containing protein [Anaerolineae bacterium]|nr:DUF2029 domain-containing protein [Anaerolineae bacterium]
MTRNYRKDSNLLFSIAVIFIIVLAAIMTWANYGYAKNNPGGNDFLVHWMGTRNLLLEGTSPYSDRTAVDIQTMAYGRPAEPGEHELRVAYPLYSIVFFTPFALIPDFTLARALWMTLLEISLIAISLLCMRMCDWKPGLLVTAVFLIFSLLWYHGMRPLINGNAVILVALFVTGGLIAMKNGYDELAGVLFAFSTIKPQLVVLFLVFVLIYSLRQSRWRLLIWMATTTLIFVMAAFLLYPNWLLENIREIIRYPGYNPPGTLATALYALMPGLGKRLPWIVAGLLGLVLLFEWFVVKIGNDFKTFLWTACLTLVISQWIGIQTDPGNFIILMPALVLSMSLLESRWRWGSVFTMLLLAGLLVFIWLLFIETGIPGAQFQQSPVMFIPLPAILFPLLYWVRWWVFRPPTVWFDEVELYNQSRR